MRTLSRFVAKFTNLIVALLSCFDRVIFKGHLPISNGPALEGFVDHVLRSDEPISWISLRNSPNPRSNMPNNLPMRRVPSTSFFKVPIAKTNSSTRSSANDRLAKG